MRLRYFGTLLILFGLGLGAPLPAQYLVSGRILDQETKEGISFAMVTVFSSGKVLGGFSTEDGTFELVLPRLDDSLQVKYVGAKMRNIWIPDLVISEFSQTTDSISHVFLKDIVMEPDRDITYCGPFMPPIYISGVSVNSTEVRRLNGASLSNSLNVLPGVQFDERGLGGSRRLSIRGSLLRSPFGVRNVRAFFNEVPLTGPDGTTPLEFLDPNQLGLIDLKKGPQGSTAGPGHGGTIGFSSREWSHQNWQWKPGAFAGFTGGSFGLRRGFAGATWRSKNLSTVAQYTQQSYAGYREQEANQKRQLEWHGTWTPKYDHKLQFDSWLYDGFWELPGGVDDSTFQADPRAALPFSERAQARVQRRWIRGQVHHHWRMGSGWETETGVYGNLTDKENPYGTSPFFQGYKIENAAGYGLRNKTSWPVGRFTQLYWGGEWQWERQILAEFDNEEGSLGQLFTSETAVNQHALLFAGAGLEIKENDLELGLGLDQVKYRFEADYPLDTGSAYRNAPVLLPSVEWSRFLGIFPGTLSISYRTGYSPPTLWELRTQRGATNLNLDPEHSQSLEARLSGWNHSAQRTRNVQYDLSVYGQEVRQAIVPGMTAQGEPFYRNVGLTHTLGLEATASFSQETNSAWLSLWKVMGSLTWQRARFGSFANQNGTSLASNWLPGLPALRSSTHLSVTLLQGWELELQWLYQGRLALDEENQHWQPAYSLFNVEVSRPETELSGSKKIFLYPSAGVTNLFNTNYNAFPALNAARERFYNAGPGRSFWLGLTLNWNVK